MTRSNRRGGSSGRNDRLAAEFRERAESLLSELAGDVSTLCTPDPPGHRLFLAEATATAPGVEIRMSFGDREFEVRTSVRPEGRPWPLELVYYMRAMELDESIVIDSMWVHDEDRMGRVMARQADALRLCLKRLEGDAHRWWSRADRERRAAIALGKTQLREKEMNVAVARAAEAFRVDDFARVISLLSPYEDILDEAQAKKLQLARARVGSEPA